MKISTIKTGLPLFGVLLFSTLTFAQSRDQNFPTPVSSSEISGTVKARDLGDSRLTSYYYAFEGTQGDIFINVVTKNFAGDIDVFTQDGLKTLTKVVVFADANLNETGRLIYLRKPEKLILRIQGRTPNDDPATFRIKFGGSFVAVKGKEEAAPAIEPETDRQGKAVNSVGTIVDVKPKALPPVSIKEPERKTPESPAKAGTKEKEMPTSKKPEVVISSTIGKQPSAVKPPTAKADVPKPREEKKADPLASIRLKIQLKDGNVIERPMTEVLKFSVDRGVLTVISRTGTITKYSIFDVTKVTIE